MSGNTSNAITSACIVAPTSSHTHALQSSIAQPTCSDNNNTNRYTATTKVLNVPELFQHILINMDMRTLLLAQRVSQAWKVTIDGSSALQIKLFFRPASDAEAVGICLEQESEVLHGVIREVETTREGFVVVGEKENVRRVVSEGKWERVEGYAVLNPLLLHPSPTSSGQDDRFLLAPSVAFRASAAGGSSKRSWARMLLSQPPSDQVHILPATRKEGEDGAAGPGGAGPCVVDPDAGAAVSLGDRVAYAKKVGAAQGFSVRWDGTEIVPVVLGRALGGRAALEEMRRKRQQQQQQQQQ